MSDPAATPATEATPAAATPATEEKVTLTKAEHDQLRRDAARAASLQSKADRFDRLQRSPGQRFAKVEKPAEPSEEEKLAKATEEDRKAERGLTSLLADPTYRELLDKDETLRQTLVKTPLAVLDLYAPDAIDAEDAMILVKEALNKRLSAMKESEAPAKTEQPPATDKPAPGSATAPNVAVENPAYEAAKKLSNPEAAVVGMLKARMKTT